MTEETSASSTNNDQVGQQSNENSASGQSNEPNANDTVAYASYHKLLGEKKKLQANYSEMNGKLEEFQRRELEVEEAQLRAKGEHEKIIANREGRIAELEASLGETNEKLNSSHQMMDDARKLNTFLRSLGGDVKDVYLTHVNLDSIAIDPATREVDMKTVEAEIERFSKTHHEIIDYGKKGKLPGNGAQGAGKISYDDWLALPLAEKKTRIKDVQ